MPATILLVDDHPVFRQGLLHLLSKEKDLRVIGEADDGQMAIDLVEQKKPDIVIMDINMPNMDGIEATRQILSQVTEIKVVALSVHSGKQFVRGMIQAGASGYILKESVPEEMVAGIRSVISGEIYLSKKISNKLISDYKTFVTESRPQRGEPVEPILYTKLHKPPISSGIIPRSRLLALLEKGAQDPMTLIAAPAGYGKSILASQWLDVSELPGAWVSIDERDNDFRLFISYFLEAIQTVFPDHKFMAKPLLDAAKLPPPAVLAHYLLNDLEAVPERFTLVIDDYHRIRNSEVHDFMTELMTHPSPSMHLALLTRRDPPLPLNTLRARRILTEITQMQLRFSVSETKLFLERFLRMTITENTAQILEKKIEGWVTGLYLAALSIRDKADQERLTTGLMETSQYVQEYLIQEVFALAPPPYDQCLMNTSILSRFCAPLCDALISALSEHDQTETHVSGQTFINWLNKRNLFVIPLDASNHWFRYHHLFSEFLQRQLLQSTGAREIAMLHSLAAEWFGSEGFITDSIDHSLSAGDVAGAADIIERYRHEEHSRDRWHNIERWLTKLPEDIVQQRPGFLLAQSWVHLCRFSMEKIPALLERVDSLRKKQTAETDIDGEVDFFRGCLQYWEGKAENALKYLENVLPNAFSKTNPHVMFMLGLARCMYGQKDTAIKDLEQQIQDAGDTAEGLFISNLIGGRAIIHLLSGELRQADLQVQRLQMAAKKSAAHNHLAWSFYLQAIVHFHRNQPVRATEHFERALQLRFTLEPRAMLDAFAGLAFVQHQMRETDKAVETTKRLLEFTQELSDPKFLPLAQSCQARLSLLQGDLASALHMAGSLNETPEPSTLFLWLEVPLITQARVFIAEGSEESLLHAANLLDGLQKQTETYRYTCQTIEVAVLQSMAREKMGQGDAAVAALQGVIASVQTGGWVRPFVEAGPPMIGLLNRLLKKNIAVEYLWVLLAACGDEEQIAVHESVGLEKTPIDIPVDSPTSPQPLVEPLTHREQDILELLSKRLQNKEIADKLFITTETVKTHLKNIYQKLDASGRRQAVVKAKALGILPSPKDQPS